MPDKEILHSAKLSLTKEILTLQAELIKTLVVNSKNPTSVGQQAIENLKLKLKDLREEVKRIKECL